MEKLFLFDIDGTLINGGGAGRRALDRACLELFGLEKASQELRLDGKTDRAIVRELTMNFSFLNPTNQNDIDRVIDQTIEKYLALLPEEVARAEQYCVLPGVADLVVKLSKNRHTVIGLASGNIKQGAKIKLDRAQLFDHFPIGGFGCDSEMRSELVGAAIKRAETFANCNFPAERIYLIGDTHLDIEAGKSLGIQTVAVATGSYTNEDLANCEPNFLFSDFSDSDYFYSVFSL